MFPMGFTSHEGAFENGVYAHWPPLPWFVGLLMRWIFIPKHKDWWRFAPCDSRMQRKELPFA